MQMRFHEESDPIVYFFIFLNETIVKYIHTNTQILAKKLRAKILVASFLDFLPIQKDDTARFDKIFIMCL